MLFLLYFSLFLVIKAMPEDIVSSMKEIAEKEVEEKPIEEKPAEEEHVWGILYEIV